MKKAAFVTNIPSPYRVDLFYYLQTHLNEYEISVIYTSRSEDNRKWDLREEKLLNTHILKSKILKLRGKLDARYIHFPANVGSVLNTIQPDVVVAFEYNPAALQSLLWCRTHKRKFIHLTDGTLYSERNLNIVQRASRKIICGSADACIASSTKAQEKLVSWGVAREKIFKSFLTVDISPYRDIPRKPVPGQLLYVGSMVKRKGLDLLISAMPYVKSPVTLHIVGNGTPEEIAELKQLAQEKNVADSIVFRGFLQGAALREEYSHAQAFVFPTREDCFGLVLLEAMGAGVPIVASKYADGAYDVVLEGENGWIADPDDAQQFAQAIDRANTVPLRGSSRQHIDQFTFESVAVGYSNALHYVLG